MLANIRVLRLLRIFRVLGLSAYVREYYALVTAIRSSGRKIFIFLSFVVMLTIIMGTIMYIVEGEESGFSSIPTSIYWAITTMTTVGFGDITPQTDLGKLIASIMMLMGWGTLAVPTGIVTAEMSHIRKAYRGEGDRACLVCMRDGYGFEDHYCSSCGSRLPPV
jgi:voltage-gated potassium channel